MEMECCNSNTNSDKYTYDQKRGKNNVNNQQQQDINLSNFSFKYYHIDTFNDRFNINLSSHFHPELNEIKNTEVDESVFIQALKNHEYFEEIVNNEKLNNELRKHFENSDATKHTKKYQLQISDNIINILNSSGSHIKLEKIIKDVLFDESFILELKKFENSNKDPYYYDLSLISVAFNEKNMKKYLNIVL